MRALIVAMTILAGAIGCGGDDGAGTNDSPAAACGDITGTWLMSYARDAEAPGDCMLTGDPTPDVITIGLNTSEKATLAFQGRSGTCSARVDGCKLTAACDYTIKADGGNGALLATGTDQFSMAFATDTFTGFQGAAITPTNEGAKLGVKQCSANFALTGKRK